MYIYVKKHGILLDDTFGKLQYRIKTSNLDPFMGKTINKTNHNDFDNIMVLAILRECNL